MIGQSTRLVIKKSLPGRIARYFRGRLQPRLDSAPAYRSALKGYTALEIGGPSSIFGDEGGLPLYGNLESVDNCLFSNRTIWTGAVQENRTFVYHPRKRAGQQFISEAASLDAIAGSAYECVLASHCLEHLSNPVKALKAWKRVLKKNGRMVLIVPHKDATFDWRRPVTNIGHMIEDYEVGVGEDDLTHLEEILKLHDLNKDSAAGTFENFRQRCLSNSSNRAMHHHVFVTSNTVSLMDYAGFKLLRVDHLKPFHIIVLAEIPQGECDNREFMASLPTMLAASPFPSDRAINF